MQTTLSQCEKSQEFKSQKWAKILFKLFLNSHILFVSILMRGANFAHIPQMVSSQQFKIYTDSAATDNLGYSNYFIEKNGELLMLKSLIQQGSIVVDAGANIGDWSEFVVSHTNAKCQLYSFEPVPVLFEKLDKKMQGKAYCVNKALGEKNSKCLINYYQKAEGCSSLFDREALSYLQATKIEISVVTLDTFFHDNDIDHIHYLKIDTEGSEWNVLQGANDLITSKKIDFIQFEYGGTYPDAGITLYQVYSYLISKDYSVFRITSDGLIYISRWRNELENYKLANYLAVRNDN